MRPGALIAYRLRWHGLALRWLTEIQRLESAHRVRRRASPRSVPPLAPHPQLRATGWTNAHTRRGSLRAALRPSGPAGPRLGGEIQPRGDLRRIGPGVLPRSWGRVVPMSEPALLWFRLDLRLTDNPALRAALGQGRPVIPVFIWSPEEEDRWEPGVASRWWLHQSLTQLDASLRQRGSRLIVRRGPTLPTIRALLEESTATAVFWNRRSEPAISDRDRRLKTTLRERGARRGELQQLRCCSSRGPCEPSRASRFRSSRRSGGPARRSRSPSLPSPRPADPWPAALAGHDPLGRTGAGALPRLGRRAAFPAGVPAKPGHANSVGPVPGRGAVRAMPRTGTFPTAWGRPGYRLTCTLAKSDRGKCGRR